MFFGFMFDHGSNIVAFLVLSNFFPEIWKNETLVKLQTLDDLSFFLFDVRKLRLDISRSY